jgi:hypothetical protein
MKLGATAKWFLGLIVLGVMYFAVVLFDVSTTAPGTVGKTFEGFLQSKQSPRKIESIEKENQKFVFVTGAQTPLWMITVPSGPPCYVFDSNGTLVDWTRDVGDDSGFKERWPYSLKREEIGVTRARQLLQRKLSVHASQETFHEHNH